jgi:hypothetical protein
MPPAQRSHFYLLLLSSLVAGPLRADYPEPPDQAGSAADLFTLRPPEVPILPGMPSLRPTVDDRVKSGDAPVIIGFADSLRPGEWERRKLLNKTAGEWGQLNSEMVFRAPEPSRDAPFERGEWSTEEQLFVPVAGPFHMFGQLNMLGEYAADQEMKVIGRTGVMLKLPATQGTQIELRGGPKLQVKDAMGRERAPEQAEVLLEVQAKWPVLTGVGLEYIGEAQPGTTPLDRPRLAHDLGLAIPVSGGKFKLGAKHRLEGLQDNRAWTGNTELYLGVEIGR